jgi:hypothetical protein
MTGARLDAFPVPGHYRPAMSGRDPGSIDVSEPWAAIEACCAKGWTDGLPVAPPTDTLVY